MSEYQFFDFQTIGRALTDEEQAEISKLSSRVMLTPMQAVFTYQFGDFRGKPEKMLEQYFDAMLYLANWGTRRLMFRFPKSLIDLAQVQPYELEDIIEFREVSDYIILDIRFDEEGVVFWVEGSDEMDTANGAGWAQLKNPDRLEGEFLGVYGRFTATREASSQDRRDTHTPPGRRGQNLNFRLDFRS